MDGWQKLLDGERDELRAHLEDEEDIMNTQELIHSECKVADQQSYTNELYALLATHEGLAELVKRFNDAGLRLKGDGILRTSVSFDGTGYRASKRSSGTVMIEGLLELQARQIEQ